MSPSGWGGGFLGLIGGFSTVRGMSGRQEDFLTV
jgi:hypothetical protein